MPTISGVVENINVQDGQGEYGPWVKLAFKVNGEWYGAFKKKDNKKELEAVGEGDVVSISYTPSGKYRNLVSIAVEKSTKDPDDNLDNVKAFKPKDLAKESTQHVPYNPGEKDFRITWLASRKDALEFVKMAIEQGAIKLGEKQANKLDILEEHLNHFNNKFASTAFEAKYTPTPIVEQDETLKIAGAGYVE